MESMYKVMMDKLSREILACDNYSWVKNAVWTLNLPLIIFDDVEIDLVQVVFASCFGGKSVVLRVM